MKGAFANGFWSNVNKYGKLFLGKNKGRSGKKYRRLGGEKPAEETHRLYE